MGLSLAFTWAARKTTVTEGASEESGPGLATAEHLDPDWRTLLPQRLRDLAEAPTTLARQAQEPLTADPPWLHSLSVRAVSPAAPTAVDSRPRLDRPSGLS
jgi:hypothetical protein